MCWFRPVTSDIIRKAKKRVLEEQEEAKNGSENEGASSPKISKPSGGRFISGMLRSVVFGPKEKHVCRCEGLHVIQNRFCGLFKKKKAVNSERNKEVLEDNIFRKKLSQVCLIYIYTIMLLLYF